MKLLVVSTWFPWPPHNGSRLWAFDLHKRLARHHRITLLSFGESAPISADRLAALAPVCDTVRVFTRSASLTGSLTRCAGPDRDAVPDTR